MTDTSYKPNEGPTSNSGEIKSFRAAEHQRKSIEQMFLHVSTYIKEDIDVLMKKANKTKTNKKDIDSINKANDMATCLVAIYNKASESEFSTFGKMFEHLKTIKPEKKQLGNESSEEDEDYEEDDDEVTDGKVM
jgi:hypothetical protein